MSESKIDLRVSPLLGGSVLTLLVLQLGLLWMQGSMLQRQHEDILGLREDVQSLAEGLDQDDDGWNASGDEGSPSPARRRIKRQQPARVAKAVFLQGGSEEDNSEAVNKDLEAARASALAAVAKAQDTRSKMSIPENIRKADEKAKLERARQPDHSRLWLGLGAGLGLLALGLGSWLRKRG